MENYASFLSPFTESLEYKVLPLAGDASTRRYFRVVTEKDSWVLMDWEPFPDSEQFPFLSVQKYFSGHGVTVPKIFACDPKQGFFLLEDLGDLTLERKFWEFQNQENIIPYYQETLKQLIKIHSLSYENQNGKSCTAYKDEFSVKRLMWEFNYTTDHLFKQYLKCDEGNPALAESHKNFQDICERLYQFPQVICHRDFHSRNVMIKHGKIHIIDFQDARLGPAVYDLVSLLCDSYVNLSPDSRDQLLNDYMDNFPHFDKQGMSRDQFAEAFSLQSIQRCLKACGSFASFSNLRKDQRYLRYIRPTLSQVLLQLENFPNYKPIKDLIDETRSQWANL